jgi:hypothetical protein
MRRAEPADDAAVLELLAGSLAWVADDRHADFYDWKHRRSPFGPSMAWLALDGEVPVGFRTFMRWEFLVDGAVHRAVRAVDTVTSGSHRGRGVFSMLTTGALEELRDDGVRFVFNTPNEASRPGYLKMGWVVVDRLRVRALPRSPYAMARMATARAAADKWSTGSAAGLDASEVLSDVAAIDRLLHRTGASDGIVTNRSPAYLSWRYGYGPLGYRVVLAGSAPEDGMAVFRLRTRGRALEATVAEILVPNGDRRTGARLVREVLRRSRADHAVTLDRAAVRGPGIVVPRQGPTLVWRGVCDEVAPAATHWRLALGDVELF